MILVTGATGNVGGQLVALLCQSAVPTRALVRSLASWLRTGELTHVALAVDHVI